MTEAEWLTASTDALLKRLGTGASERRLRLFACACCRRAPWLAQVDQFEDHLCLVEQYADGGLDESVRQRTQELSKAMWDSYYHSDGVRTCLWMELHRASQNLRSPDACDYGKALAAGFGYAARLGLGLVSYPASNERTQQLFDAAKRVERQQQAFLVRDIFGKSFHKKARIQRQWRTSTAVALAQQMYECRDFSTMPILADALQDAGCVNEDILNHCRSDGPHVRGCWVVDMLLGKS